MKLSELFREGIYDDRIKVLEDKYVTGLYFHGISKGTTGKIKILKKTGIVKGYWPGGLDLVVSGIGEDGKPNETMVYSKSGEVVAATLDPNGCYHLSDIPSSYPVAIVYAYRCRFVDYDDNRNLK